MERTPNVTVDPAKQDVDAASDFDSVSTGLFPSTESEAQTYNALQKTYQQLDGIILSLNQEASRKERPIQCDDSESSSDYGEHGESELRAELDSVFLPPWKKYLVKEPSPVVQPNGAVLAKQVIVNPPHTSCNVEESNFTMDDVEQQGATIGQDEIIERVSENEEDLMEEIIIETPPAGLQLTDGLYEKNQNESGISVDSTQTPLSQQESRGDQAVPLDIKTDRGIHESVFSVGKAKKALFLQLCCVMITLVVLAGAAALILVTTGSKDSKEPATVGGAASSFSTPTPTMSPTTTLVNGTEDLLGLETPTAHPTVFPPTTISIPISAPATLSPSTNDVSMTLEPTQYLDTNSPPTNDASATIEPDQRTTTNPTGTSSGRPYGPKNEGAGQRRRQRELRGM